VRIDGNDTGGLFDVARTSIAPGSNLTITISTFKRWTPFEVWDHGFFVITLDTRGDERPDYEVLVRSNSRRMIGHLRSENRQAPLGPVPVVRPNRRSVRIRITIGRLDFDPSRRFERWQATSVWDEPPCSRTCFDRVDNAGPAPMPR
jgi:hypothetical protein